MVENEEITEDSSTLRHGVRRARGGARLGAGRKPKPKDPSLLQRAYAVLDEATVPALNAVVRLLSSRNEMTRLRAAQEILSKRIPDLKQETGARAKEPLVINIIRANEGDQASNRVTKPDGEIGENDAPTRYQIFRAGGEAD